jgi:hypothetical protein
VPVVDGPNEILARQLGDRVGAQWPRQVGLRIRPPEAPVEDVVGLDMRDRTPRELREVSPLREELPDQPVGVLVGAALPGAVRVREVDLDPRLLGEEAVFGYLLPPGRTSASAPTAGPLLARSPLPPRGG